MNVAQLRDQGIPPQTVLNSMLRSNLPDDVKREAPNIIKLVYEKFANIPPEEIGPAVYGACMELNTGIRREA